MLGVLCRDMPVPWGIRDVRVAADRAMNVRRTLCMI
jgi:hypothetical protein